MKEEFEKYCNKHGLTIHVRENWNPKQVRCKKCRSEYVSKARRKVKSTLVEEAGGKCQICGYSKCKQALEFHHKNPDQKIFHLGHKGLTRSLRKSRIEAKKCVLVCANCHREIEAGITKIKDSILGEGASEPRCLLNSC